jgi:glycosyltransferase involved in cell wall biosynthesis
MQLIVMDNGLGYTELGHHHHMARHVIADARRFGCDAQLFAMQAAPPEVLVEFGARPVFSIPHYQPVGFDPLRAFARVDRFLNDFAATGVGVAPNDLILLPTASVIELYAMVHWHRLTDIGLKFAFLFHSTVMPETREPLAGYLWAATQHLLTGIDPSRFWIGATTPELARHLGEKLTRPIHVVASVTWPPAPIARTASAAPRVGFLGGLRPAKGSLRIPRLVQHIHAKFPDWQVVIQAPDNPALAQALGDLATDPAVTIIDQPLNDDALNALMASLDVLICPYDRGYYGQAASGLMTLAASLGVACVVPSDTTLAAEMRGPARPLGRVYEGDSDEAIIDAVADLVADRAALAEGSGEAAARWRAHASGETFMRDLLTWAGVAVPAVTSTPVA